MDKYCPPCDFISVKEATRNGWLSPYKEYKVLIDVDLTEYQKANSEFIRHFSFFDFNWDLSMDCVTNVFKQQQYAKQINCDVKEVKAHAYAWMRALQFRKSFISKNPKKIEIAKLILSARADKKCITFNSSIKQCESYGFGYVVHSEKKKKENKEILEEFSKCQNAVIHSSKMLIEGLDVKGLSVAIITGFNSSQIAHTQSIGRCIRFEEGKEAEVFVLVLKGTVEEKWYSNANKGNDYMEITERELQDILNYKPIKNKQIINQTNVNKNMRF